MHTRADGRGALDVAGAMIAAYRANLRGREIIAMAGIFISYRRDDSAPWTGRVYERLAREFDRDRIFMDVDNITPGLDFVEELGRQVGSCDALVAVMGRGWAEARNSNGTRRLDDPNDFVRIELEQALARGVRVIPVLVDGAAMPSSNELPEGLRLLVRRHAVEVTHARFGSDVQRLVDALAPVGRTQTANPIGRPRAQSSHPARPETAPAATNAFQAFARLCAVLATVVLLLVTWGYMYDWWHRGDIVPASQRIFSAVLLTGSFAVAGLWAWYIRRRG